MSKSKNSKSYYGLRPFLTYMGRHKSSSALVLLCFIIANVLIAVLPLYIGKLVGALAEQPADRDAALLYMWILIGCSVFHMVFWHGAELLYRRLLNPAVIAYENLLFQRAIKSPYPYFVDKFTGKISSYITTISRESKNFYERIFWNYTNQVISLITVGAILTSINWQTGAIFASGLLLMLLLGRVTLKNSIRYEKIWTDVESDKNSRIIDAVANFVNIKSFHKEAAEIGLIRQQQDKNIDAANRSLLWTVVFWAAMGSIVRSLIWPATIVLNVFLFLDGQLTVAELATILSVILMFSQFIWEVVWNVSQFGLQMARMEEAHDYLFGKVNVAAEEFDSPRQPAPDFQTDMRLQHLNFEYPDNKKVSVLRGIDLHIKKGEKIGIVGKSGSGKTTLTKLLLGYYPVATGQILLDGKPVRTREFAKLISYVPQDTSLFHRSIAENIAYAADRQVSRQEIEDAARRAYAHDFISGTAEGYKALVGERGVKLSTGQRQRIAIARAYLDDKPLLILDEATSALDSESEVLVQQALEALWEDKTVIAIAHRLSTLRNMDRIIVMENGRIVEQGSHAELLRQKGRYAALWTHQSGGFIED